MLRKLKAFEATTDALLARLPLLQLPARAVLAGLHYIVFLSSHGSQLGGELEPGTGETILQRLSHALPLIRGLDPLPFGESAEDAIGAFSEVDPERRQLAELLAYLHFSEFMPEAHRGYYAVEGDAGGFRLRHRDVAFAQAQAKDITLSELAIPFPLEQAGQIEPGFAALAATAPMIDWKFATRFIVSNAHKYRHGLAEADLITDASMNHMFGFGRERFLQIRSTVLAYAEFCEKLAITIHALVLAKRLPEDRLAEALEWTSVNQKADFLISLLAVASGSALEEVERFLELYTIDFRQSPASDWGGDGFFPPFARFDQGYLFSPRMVMAFLQVRNSVFAFSRKDQRTFDNDVSHELEPVLLRQASELFRQAGGWIVIEDTPFPGGQIDLIVASPDDDAVLLVQAKGNLPPQGARLTDRLAGRIREGVRQIDRFSELPEQEQRIVVERALNRKVGDVDIKQAILARSCFGAVEVFAPEFPHVLLTLPLLALALQHHREAALPTTIAALRAAVDLTSERIFETSGFRWEQGEINLAGARIEIPLLQWHAGSLERLRREWWDSTLRPGHD